MRPGNSRSPRMAYPTTPSVPTENTCTRNCAASSDGGGEPPASAIASAIGSRSSGEKARIPATPVGPHLMRSIAASRSFRSEVNCCKAPMPALVRMMATKSSGCICSSTNFFNARRTKYVLSNERPMSSTIIATVRRMSSGFSRAGGIGGAFLSFNAGVGGRAAPDISVRIYEK